MYKRPTMFVSLVSHPTPSASTLGRGIRWCNVHIFMMHVSVQNNWTMITYSVVIMLNCSYEHPMMFIPLVSHPTPSASTLGQGTRRPNVYTFVMHVSPWINLTTMNNIVVILVQGPTAYA
jgi:hypothetical protein